MNELELLNRIAKGENLHTEFKTWPSKGLSPENLASEIVAFANTDGGEIFLGIDDEGQIIGIDEDIDNVTQFVDNVAYNNCEPPISVIQETVKTSDEKIVLVVHVPKGSQRPYKTKRGIYYIRTTSGKRQASREELLRLFQASTSLFADEIPIIQTSLLDIDYEKLEKIIQKVKEQGLDINSIPKERLLINWKLLKSFNGQVHLTLAGVLFLTSNPQTFVPFAYISALYISGEDISIEPSDQKRIEGDLLSQIEGAVQFLRLHLLRPHKIKDFEPEIIIDVPFEALREAILNALAHRDYTVSSPIRLIIFNDRIEIRTPGSLPNTVEIEDLRYGIHVLRNPIIYSMLLRLGYVTNAGSGIPRMIRLIKKNIGKEPDFKIEGNEFVVALPRKNHAMILIQKPS